MCELCSKPQKPVKLKQTAKLRLSLSWSVLKTWVILEYQGENLHWMKVFFQSLFVPKLLFFHDPPYNKKFYSHYPLAWLSLMLKFQEYAHFNHVLLCIQLYFVLPLYSWILVSNIQFQVLSIQCTLPYPMAKIQFQDALTQSNPQYQIKV